MRLWRSRIEPRETFSSWVDWVCFISAGCACGISRGLRTQNLRATMGAFSDPTLEIPTDAQLWCEAADLALGLERGGNFSYPQTWSLPPAYQDLMKQWFPATGLSINLRACAGMRSCPIQDDSPQRLAVRPFFRNYSMVQILNLE